MKKMLTVYIGFLLTIVSLSTNLLFAQVELPYVDFPSPTKPGLAEGEISDSTVTLGNNVMRMTWDVSSNTLVPLSFENKLSGVSIDYADANSFSIGYANGSELKGNEFEIVGSSLEMSQLAPVDPNHIKLAKRIGGLSIELTLLSPKKDLEVSWKAILLDNTNYIRQEYSFKNLLNQEQWVSYYNVMDQNGIDPVTQGVVAGSPVTDGNVFMGLESPYAFHSISSNKRLIFWIKKTSSLAPNSIFSLSTVVGVAPADQMRRAFLYYISLERAHYYRQYTHFNSWYDVGYYTESWLKTTMETLHSELGVKRGLPINSFVIDDGWDNPNNPETWSFNGNLSNGFENLVPLAETNNAGFGVWMSPFGGYGGREARINASKAYGAETKIDTIDGRELFSLAGPNYYNRFKTAALDLIENHGLNFLKVEMGAWDTYREQWQDDQEATLRLADTLRLVDPEFYFNASSGTYPSPFWLRHIESTWRAWGGDAPNLIKSFTGDHPREHWIGGRDYSTYVSIVQKSPLYPISSLMLHGITIGTRLYPATYPNDLESISHEVRSFYASGITCSELYVSHSILTPEMYDLIAEAGKWAYNNRDILEDAHWVGGDPGNGDVYGKAGWNKRGGYLFLRNPTTSNKSFSFDIAEILELPEGAEQNYFLKSPWLEDAGKDSVKVSAGSNHTINLRPLEVVVLNALPETPYVSIKSDNKVLQQIRVAQIIPNPFRYGVSIDVSYLGKEKLEVQVLNANGTVLRKFTNVQPKEGGYKLDWDGADGYGKPVSPGLYFLRLNAGTGKKVTKRIIKL